MWKIILIALLFTGCSRGLNEDSYELGIARKCRHCTFAIQIVLLTGDTLTINELGSVVVERDEDGTPKMFITENGYMIPMTSVLWARYGE